MESASHPFRSPGITCCRPAGWQIQSVSLGCVARINSSGTPPGCMGLWDVKRCLPCIFAQGAWRSHCIRSGSSRGSPRPDDAQTDSGSMPRSRCSARMRGSTTDPGRKSCSSTGLGLEQGKTHHDPTHMKGGWAHPGRWFGGPELAQVASPYAAISSRTRGWRSVCAFFPCIMRTISINDGEHIAENDAPGREG